MADRVLLVDVICMSLENSSSIDIYLHNPLTLWIYRPYIDHEDGALRMSSYISLSAGIQTQGLCILGMYYERRAERYR